MYALHWLRKMNSNSFKEMGSSPSNYSGEDEKENIKSNLNQIAVTTIVEGGRAKFSHDNEQLTLTIYSEKYGEIVHIYTIVEV